MFLLSLRDRFGLGLALKVILIWQLCFLAGALTRMPSVFIIFYTLALLMTARASIQLWRGRDQLRFVNAFGKHLAFPLDRRRARMALNLHIAIAVLLFVIPILLLATPRANVDLTESLGVLYGGFLLGQFGMVGIVHHLVLSALGYYEDSADRR